MTDQDIRLDVKTAGGHVLVEVSGEIDLSTAPTLRAALDGVIDDGARELILDLEGVRFMDSTGLRVLMAVVNRRESVSLSVVACPPLISRIFSITGVDRVIPMFVSVEAAVEAMANDAALE